MRPPRRRGYRELLLLLGLVAFAASVTGSFWVVFLSKVRELPPELVASLFAGATFVAAAMSFVLSRVPSLPATKTMIAGLACLAGMQVALAALEGPPLYALFALLYGLYIPLFFLPWNVLVTEQTRFHDRGAKLAGISLGYNAAAVGAPFIGGLVAGLMGFPALFLLGAGVLVVAATVAALYAQRPDDVRLRFDLRRLGGRVAAAYLAQGGIDGVLWTAIPLVALTFVTQDVQLGALFSLFALMGGVFGVVLGRWSDRIRRRRRFIVLGATLPIPLAVAVALAPNLAVFAIANGLLSATLIVGPTFVNAVAVDRLEGEVGLVMCTREALLNVSRGTTSVAILVLFLLGLPVQLVLLLVAVLLPLEALAR